MAETTEAEAERLAVLGLSAAEFQMWRHHPVSKVILRFLERYRRASQELLLRGWQTGSLRLVDEQEARGRWLAIEDILNLEWESIRAFYDADTPAEDASTAEMETSS